MKHKSSILSFLLGAAVTFLLGASSVFQFTLSSDTLYVDGVKLDKSLYKYEGSNYLPLRATAEALGADVQYDNGRIDIISKMTDAEAVAAKCRDSCVMVYVYNNGTVVRMGSGFCYNGYIITAEHLMDDGDVYAIFPDEQVSGVYTYKVDVQTDLDIAVLTADIDLPSVTLGDSDKLREGQKLISITSPKGAQNIVDECLYSGKALVNGEFILGISDSSINVGSSGGAVFDMDGELIGVVRGGVEGVDVATAIPINMVKPILEQLK